MWRQDSELRSRLWESVDWGALAQAEATSLVDQSPSPEVGERALAVVELVEDVALDRRPAIDLCVLAWRADPSRREIMGKARALCHELADYARAAQLAQLECQVTNDPSLPLVQGLALIDAGQVEASAAPLSNALSRQTDDRALAILVQAVAGRLNDPSTVLREFEATAREESSRFMASAIRLLAARLAKIAAPELHAPLVERAFADNPRDEIAYSLAERLYIEREQWTRLANVYRQRAEAAGNGAELVNVYRRAGARLLLSGLRPGLGIRLLKRALEFSYERNYEVIPGHIAILQAVLKHARATRAETDTIELITRGLAMQRSDDERLWLALAGLRLASGRLNFERSARLFAHVVRQLAPAHPILHAPVDAPVQEPSTGGHDVRDLGAEILVELDDGEPESVDLSDVTSDLQEHAKPDEHPQQERAPRMSLVADVRLSAPASLKVDGRSVQATTRDISASGIFLACDEPIEVGREVEISLALPGEDDWSLVEHHLRGTVVRIEAGVGFGLHLIEPPTDYIVQVGALLEQTHQSAE